MNSSPSINEGSDGNTKPLSTSEGFSIMDASNSGGSSNLDIPPAFVAQNLGRKICCIGAGRLGILSMMVLAHRWPDLDFFVLDKNEIIIDQINANPRVMPFSEPGLHQVLDECQNLRFSTDMAELVDCHMIFIAVDIPLMKQPKVVKGNLNSTNWESAIRAILGSMVVDEEKFVAIKSTFHVDYNSDIRKRLSGYIDSDRLHVITIPEFFSEGTAIEDLSNPQKIVMGKFYNDDDETALDLFSDLYARLVENDPNRIYRICSTSSVEIGKLISNACIAAQLTIMNIGSSLCYKVEEANFRDVKRAVECHPRVSPFFLDSRPGYGGLGLTKDVSYLEYLCQRVGLDNERKFFKLINEMRTAKMDELVRRISQVTLSSKTLAIYGFSNKVNTDDVRESPSLYITRELLKCQGNRLVIYDPLVPRYKIRDYFARSLQNRVEVAANMEDAWQVDVTVFMVNWPQFKIMLQQQRGQLLGNMRGPNCIFDCCGLIEDGEIFENTRVYRL